LIWSGAALTAVLLKWFDFIKRRAVIVLSAEGSVHWVKSSEKAFRSGRYFTTRQGFNEVSDLSLAAQERFSFHARDGVRHKAGIWF